MKLSGDFQFKLLLAGLALGGVAFFLLKKTGAAGVGVAVGEAVGGFVADVGTGAVVGIGSVFGIPRTDETECQKAIREGRTWDASFSCPAGEFITGAVPSAASELWGNITSLFGQSSPPPVWNDRRNGQ